MKNSNLYIEQGIWRIRKGQMINQTCNAHEKRQQTVKIREQKTQDRKQKREREENSRCKSKIKNYQDKSRKRQQKAIKKKKKGGKKKENAKKAASPSWTSQSTCPRSSLACAGAVSRSIDPKYPFSGPEIMRNVRSLYTAESPCVSPYKKGIISQVILSINPC